jgi:hypothetical protein
VRNLRAKIFFAFCLRLILGKIGSTGDEFQ